jgi:hypothetical protein
MMNKDIIRNTAIQTWDEENGYIVESPLCPDVTGIDDDKEVAWQIFYEILDEYWVDYLAGRLANPVMGRPSTGKERLGLYIAPDIKQSLGKLSEDKGISYGEAVEFLLGYWNRTAVSHER